MKPETASSQKAAASTTLVWDAPVRLVHWLMALCFTGAWLTAEADDWRALHVTLGYTMAGLIVFRLFWGLVGTRPARFSSFVRGPARALGYLRSLLTRHPEHHAGHNPAGGLAILALLGLGLAVTLAGWATWRELGGEWVEELHEGAASAMLGLVLFHIAAVVLSSRLHHENLARAMLTGRKRASPAEGIRRAWFTVAALVLAAVLGFWWLQWQAAVLVRQ